MSVYEEKAHKLSELEKEQANESEAIVNELEGQRVFGAEHYEFWLISVIALSWSLFQLYIVVEPINSTITRSIHLSFAMFLAFLIYPMFKKTYFLKKIRWFGFTLTAIGVGTASYIAVFYEEISQRPGDYIALDIIVALVGIVILLEAGRRVLGLALSIIAIVFLAYDFLGPYMPELIIHKGASLNKLAGHMFLTTEGIFGVPLGVSAGFVFLFVLFGSLLDKAGAGEYFINLAFAMLGKYRGGPAKASVVASGFTGIISGSSIANTVTTGTFTIPLMKKAGFRPEQAGAVEVASSTNGQLMPPVMGAAAFIIAEFLGMAYTDVIVAAFIPAFVSYFALFYIVHLEALKLGLKGMNKEDIPPKWETFMRGIHYLIPIFFLMYTLMVLRESAASAAFNAIMLLMLLMVVQHPFRAFLAKEKLTRDIYLSGFVDILAGMISGAKNMIPIAIATALAGIVVGSITLTGLGQVLLEVIETLSGGNIFIILILAAVVSLILGMGLPTTANYIVMASLTAPVILILAQDNGFLIPAIAAHLFVFYFGILADDTPPVGLAAYAAAGIAKADPIKTGIQGFKYDIRTAILPFMFFFNPELLLISGVDELNPANPQGWIWITNPVEILVIFTTAFIGMVAFSCATQGYFITRTNIFERLIFLTIVPFMFLPKIIESYLSLPTHYLSYAIGLGIFAMIYIFQKAKVKAEETSPSEVNL
ncbi:TRAP transporter permease [Poseidonibacter ostreae]|uniref:TRAP transporter fused permease subunit n=1 Tax=Poseidonibacter ostreae TaxID=2654171 RepID=A0A6L4WTD3_9BACT|nr:TRAP transporter permease [Poseidonibacter ostreae]KAB7886683.1 TRAP transporter fused permease subunit [Poseidonibacter ostreae]KAB7889075.1 TRAP transporter fused permease subunit [Poseidonibacter ostreae]KAB7891786.1 TRAP transporter fused permease subunit [Poseidonibacter ostreae]MAC83999.1 C4-dicarboxylate ABC transporter [Arcobacter sp.]|tara:strand:- start:6502 stop:8625 length:2124 start_codon:yes stop_codon:yes gene_type:complete